MANLAELLLHNNQLIALPIQLKSLVGLKTLTLSENNLPELSGAIVSGLVNLCILKIDNNKISSLPAEIRVLTKLHTLGCHGNQLSTVPSEIKHLVSLTELNLSHNNLTSLPNELSQLPKLKKLFLDHNKLSSFIPNWANSRVIYLSLDNNQFRDVTSLSNLSTAKKIIRLSLKV
jgi:Leucine-rich repeat (LRR) protein